MGVFPPGGGMEIARAESDHGSARLRIPGGAVDTQTIECPRPFIGYSRTPDDRLTVFEIHGEATPAGVVSLFSQFSAHPTPCLLWDLRSCSLAHFTAADLRSMVDQLVHLDAVGARVGNGRSAFVCSSDADALVMRGLIRHAQARDYGIELALFRDAGAARLWLAKR